MSGLKLHSGHIESAVVRLLNYRVYTIVPNVREGLNLSHECDLLCLDGKGRFMEIEIKISAGDLKADFKKSHGHRSKYIGRLAYAMPKELAEKYKDLIPENCGLISVQIETLPKYKTSDLITYTYLTAKWIRLCKHNKATLEVPVQKQLDFMRLGCMRIWSLKAHNNGKLTAQK